MNLCAFGRVLVLLLTAAGLPAAAWAKPVRGAAPQTAAPEPGELGTAAAALARHDAAAAEQQLVTAYRRAPQAEILYLLGTVARERGDLIATHDYWRRYLADPSTDGNSPHAQEVEKFLLAPRGPSGELHVVSEGKGLIFVDEHLAGAVPLSRPLLLSAGAHRIRLELGRKELAAELQIADGRGAQVRVVADYDALLVSVPPAVLLLPQWQGLALPTQRRLLQEAEQAIRRANHAIFDTATALAHAPQYGGCLDQLACQRQLAAVSAIDFVLALKVTAGEPASGPGPVAMSATLQSPQIALPAAAIERDCPTCSVEQAAAQLAALVEEAVQKGSSRGRGSLQVTSEPAGAEIRLGSDVLGKTPATLALWSGEYDLTLALPRRPPASVHAVVSDGSTSVVNAGAGKGSARPEGSQDAGGRPRWRLITGGIAVGVGLFMLGNGISAALIDGHCAQDLGSQPPGCPGREVFMTQTPAVALSIAGAATTTFGIVLLAIPGRSARRAPP